MDLKNEETTRYTKYSSTIDVIFDTQLDDSSGIRYELADVFKAYSWLEKRIEGDSILSQEYKDELKKRIEERKRAAGNREGEIKKANENYTPEQYDAFLNAVESHRKMPYKDGLGKLRTMLEKKGYYVFFNKEQIEAIYDWRIDELDFGKIEKEFPFISQELQEAINIARDAWQRNEQ